MQIAPSMHILGTQTDFEHRSATCSRLPPPSFLLKLCVIVLHTHGYPLPKFRPNPKHHDGVVILAHFARACCYLLLAKPIRSTRDPK